MQGVDGLGLSQTLHREDDAALQQGPQLRHIVDTAEQQQVAVRLGQRQRLPGGGAGEQRGALLPQKVTQARSTEAVAIALENGDHLVGHGGIAPVVVQNGPGIDE